MPERATAGPTKTPAIPLARATTAALASMQDACWRVQLVHSFVNVLTRGNTCQIITLLHRFARQAITPEIVKVVEPFGASKVS